MMSGIQSRSIQLAIAIALAGVAIHIGAIFGGPSWFRFFGAPPQVIASAEQGTWLAPVGSLVIAGLMGLCGWYGASALGWVRRPWLQRPGLACMASVCIARALILPILAFKVPQLINTFEIVAALIWLLAGIGLAAGFRATRNKQHR